MGWLLWFWVWLAFLVPLLQYDACFPEVPWTTSSWLSTVSSVFPAVMGSLGCPIYFQMSLLSTMAIPTAVPVVGIWLGVRPLALPQIAVVRPLGEASLYLCRLAGLVWAWRSTDGEGVLPCVISPIACFQVMLPLSFLITFFCWHLLFVSGLLSLLLIFPQGPVPYWCLHPHRPPGHGFSLVHCSGLLCLSRFAYFCMAGTWLSRCM